MKVHIFKLTCDICGGEGMGTIHTAGAAWDTRNMVAHTDPNICRAVLERQRRELEALRAEAA